jgi:hypothetical protein
MPALVDCDNDDDDSIDDMPALHQQPCTIHIEGADDESINNLLAEEDGWLDDHVIDDNLKDLDEHGAKWQAHIARRAADFENLLRLHTRS